MKPDISFISIDDNINKVKQFISEIIIEPKHSLRHWSEITNQTPAAKIGYIGQHLASLITGVKGIGSGARGDDLEDKSEVKSCNKVDQVDKCRDCNCKVLRFEEKCPHCNSTNIERKEDSKWLFSVRDEQELYQYLNLNRIVLILMDYPNFKQNDFKDIRISVFEIYPKEARMSVFCDLIKNHYNNIYLPKLKDNAKTNPMNLHPFSFQFYKCNPIQTFETIIKNVDSDNAKIEIKEELYIHPKTNRTCDIPTIPMPTHLLKSSEWEELLSNAKYSEIKPLLTNPTITKNEFLSLSLQDKAKTLPYLDETLRNYISLREIKSVRHKQHYQR